MFHRNYSVRAAVLRRCFDISSRPTAASWKVEAVMRSGFMATAVVACLGLGGCALPDDGGVAERNAVDICRAAQCVVDLEVSRDTGTYEQQLLLGGDREVSLLDGSARRVYELVPAQALRLDRGSTGVVTALRPFSSSPDVDMRPRESARHADGLAQAGRVTGTIFHLADVLTTIRTAQGSIVTTPDHPFMTVSSGWTEAGKLEVGSLVITSLKDAPVPIVSVQSARVTPTPVYNLTVEGSHTYFVGPESLLVHNMDRCGDAPSSSDEARNPAQRAIDKPPGALTEKHLNAAKDRANARFDGVTFTDKEFAEVNNALTTLATSKGTKGGRSHGNNNKPPLLPELHLDTGKRIKYFEYDLSPHDGARDGKRLIIGDDGSAYITGNHYHGFMPIKMASQTKLDEWRNEYEALQNYGYVEPEATNTKDKEKAEGSGTKKDGKDKGAKGKPKGKK